MGMKKVKERIKKAAKARRMKIRSFIDLITKHHNKEIPYIKESIIKDNYAVFRLRGDIDAQTIPELTTSRKEEELLSDKHIILDFKEVEHVDTATLALLVDVFDRIKVQKKRLVIIHATKMLKNYIEILELKSVVKVYPSERQAVKALRENTA